MPLVSSGEYPFHLCKVSFHEYYKSTLALHGALADSYAVENPNVDFEDLSHTSQRTKSCLHPSRRCGIIALPESQHGNVFLYKLQ